jgi:hypothetical protein
MLELEVKEILERSETAESILNKLSVGLKLRRGELEEGADQLVIDLVHSQPVDATITDML